MRESGVTATLRPHAGNGRDGVRSCLRVFTKPQRGQGWGSRHAVQSGVYAHLAFLCPAVDSERSVPFWCPTWAPRWRRPVCKRKPGGRPESCPEKKLEGPGRPGDCSGRLGSCPVKEPAILTPASGPVAVKWMITTQPVSGYSVLPYYSKCGASVTSKASAGCWRALLLSPTELVPSGIRSRTVNVGSVVWEVRSGLRVVGGDGGGRWGRRACAGGGQTGWHSRSTCQTPGLGRPACHLGYHLGLLQLTLGRGWGGCWSGPC